MDPIETGWQLVDLEAEIDTIEYMSELQSKLDAYGLELGVEADELFE